MNWSPAQIGALENCGVKVEDATGDISFREFEFIDIIKPEPLKATKGFIKFEEATRLPNYNKVGNIIDCYLAWRGTNYMIKMFFPSVKKPSRREVQDQLQKVYPGSRLWNYQVSDYDPGAPLLQVGGQK
jgi:hypothetical protein